MSSFDLLTEVIANESHFHIDIAGIPSSLASVTDMKSINDELCRDYCFEVDLLSPELLSPDNLIGKDVTLTIVWGMSDRTISGVVGKFVARGESHQGYHYELSINSHLFLLKHKRSNRVFTNMSVDALIKKVFEKSGFPMAMLDMQASGPTLEMVVQYNETDYEFVDRMMRKHGFVFGTVERGGSPRLTICNSSASFAANMDTLDILYQPPSATVRASESIFAVSRKSSLLTQNIHLNDYNYENPSNLNVTKKSSSNIAGFGESSIYGENYRSSGEGNVLAEVRRQSFDCQRDVLIIDTDCRAIRPGCIINIIDHPDYSDSYLVTKVAHMGSQSGGVNYGSKVKNLLYKNQAHLIPLDTDFKAEVPESAKVFTSFNAVIEQEVDDKGRYVVKMPFNQDGEGEESRPTRMIQPYGGSGHGMNFPLTQGTEVIVAGENGDLDRPIILGAVYNENAPSPVTSENNTENLIVTRAGHKLLMDDEQGSEKIELSNPGGANVFTMFAPSDADHFAELNSKEGDIKITAKKDLAFTSEGNHFITTEKVMTVGVTDHIKMLARENNILLRAGQGINVKAGTNIRFEATESNLDLVSQNDINLQAAQDASLYSQSGNIEIKAQQSDLSLEAGANIIIKSTNQGSINISQGSGSIEIDAGGNLNVNATTITLSASNIAIKGNAVSNN